MASKKITEMVEVFSLEDTDFITGIDMSAPVDSDKNVKITKSALGFAADTDPRLSDARTPSAHAGTHEDGGSDELALVAAQITDFQTEVNSNTKLAGIEAGATADQTPIEIKVAYESNGNTNAFLDADKTKLAGIEAGATGDQTPAEIKVAYESNLNTNAFTDAEKTTVANAVTVETDPIFTAHPAANVKDNGSATEFLSGNGTYQIPAGNSDELSAISATDTTPDYLQSKLTSSDASVTFTRTNPGGNEQLNVQATGAGGGETNAGVNLGIGSEVYIGKNGVNLEFRTIDDSSNIVWTQTANLLTAEVPADTFDPFGLASTVQGNLDFHTGDATIHFTQGAISIPASQISDFDTEVANNTTVAANTSKLAGIENNATADQTAAEIKSAYESNANTNAFTDAEQTKVSNALTSTGSIDTHTDVDTTTAAPTNGQVLGWDGSNWAPIDVTTNGVEVYVQGTAPTGASDGDFWIDNS